MGGLADVEECSDEEEGSDDDGNEVPRPASDEHGVLVLPRDGEREGWRHEHLPLRGLKYVCANV